MATAPKNIAADLADSVFGVGPKVATMTETECDRNEWPLHFAAADAFGGSVLPFDKYQGPYIKIANEGRLFIYSSDGVTATVYNEDTKKESTPFPLDASAENQVIEATASVCEGVTAAEEEEKVEKEAALEREPLNSPLEGKSASFSKTADGSMLGHDDQPSATSKLQQIMGDPLDQPISAFAQFYPNVGSMQTPNPLSPIEGDACFFMYMVPGAVFQSHDGQQWDVLDYNGGAYGVHIQNRWYPRLLAWVNIDDVRRSIHSWVEPVQIVVPPPPPGVNYVGQPVRIVDGKSHA